MTQKEFPQIMVTNCESKLQPTSELGMVVDKEHIISVNISSRCANGLRPNLSTSAKISKGRLREFYKNGSG